MAPFQYEPSFLTLAALSARPPASEPERRLVLWPEGVLPDYLREGYPERFYAATTAGRDPAFARARLARVIGEGGLLLTGTTDLEVDKLYQGTFTIDAQASDIGSGLVSLETTLDGRVIALPYLHFGRKVDPLLLDAGLTKILAETMEKIR